MAGNEAALTAGESLALIETAQASVARGLTPDLTWFYGPWGLAYLLGFGSVFLTYHSSAPFRLASPVAGVITAALFTGAVVSSAVTGARAGRGVSGPSRVVGAMYGWAWVLGFAALAAVNTGVTRLGVPDRAATLLWSGSAPLLVGVLYLAGGALWQDRFQYALGVWMLLTGAASVFAGVPGNFAVLSLAGGGGLLLAAGYFAVRRRRPQAAA